MMRIFLLLLLLTTLTFPQENLSSNFVLKGGVSIPTGDFSEDTNGGAVTGFGVGFSFSVPINNMLSFEWDLIGTLNSIDVDKLEQYAGVNIEAENWLNFYGLIGPRLDAAISTSSAFFMSAKVGAIYANSPKLEFSSGGETIEMESTSALGLAFNVGGGISFKNFEMGFYYISGGEPEFESDFSFTRFFNYG